MLNHNIDYEKIEDPDYLFLKNIYEEKISTIGTFGKIQSFENYKNIMNKIPKGGKYNNYHKWYKILKELKEIINIDPIKYIIYLHLKEGKGFNIKKIYNYLKNNELKNCKNFKNENHISFNYFLNNILGWQIKENLPITKKVKKRKKINPEKILTGKLKKLKNETEPENVETIVLAPEMTINEKVKEILGKTGYINTDNFHKVFETLCGQYGLKCTVSAIQNIIDLIPEANGIKFEGINITKKMKLEISGITNLNEFEEKCTRINGEIKEQYKNIYSFLKDVQNYIVKKYNDEELDPIEYLIYLYSLDGKGLNIVEIYNILGEYYKGKNVNSFRKIFRSTLGWNLR